MYFEKLKDYVIFQKFDEKSYNYSYLPIVFETEDQLVVVEKALNKENIYPRRYFYPSLDTIDFLKSNKNCSLSIDLSKRIICLPSFNKLTNQQINTISEIIINNIEKG